MQKLFINYVGKLPRSKAGHSALLVCVDAFSKFVWMISAREVTSQSAIRALEQRIFSNFSVPELIVTDNARCFTWNKFQQFCFGLGIKQITTSPYYPQPSHAERFNKNLCSALFAYHCDAHTSWDTQQLAFNMAEHEASKATPFSVMFPFRANHPLQNRWKIMQLLPKSCTRKELKRRWADVRKNLWKSHHNMAERYNRKRAPVPFRPGDLVYYRNHPQSDAKRRLTAKFAPRWKWLAL
jgi:transposase InsO family protein